MRRPTMILATCALLISWAAPSPALTSRATCRSACAPRIAEQCGGRVGPDLRRCRRPLLRACRASTPEQACPTAADLTPTFEEDVERAVALARALADQQVHRIVLDDAGRPEQHFVTLCSSGAARVIRQSIVLFAEERGTWSVDATGTSITLTLGSGGAFAFEATLLEDGGVVVDGEPSTLRDARPFCTDLDLRVRFVDRLVGNAYVIETTRGEDLPVRTKLAFCDAERLVRAGAARSELRWLVERLDGAAELQLVATDGSVTRLPLTQESDGTVLVRGARPLDDGGAVLLDLCA